MKRFYSFVAAFSFLIVIPNLVNAQTNQPQLNQIELFKQLIGSWTAEMGKDTTVFWEAKLFGTGIEDYMEFITKGKGYLKIKGLFGYDKESDKIIEATVLYGSDIISNAYWFTSENKCKGVPFKYLSNPENSVLRWEIEFKTPDMWVVTSLEDNKAIEIDTLYRLGK